MTASRTKCPPDPDTCPPSLAGFEAALAELIAVIIAEGEGKKNLVPVAGIVSEGEEGMAPSNLWESLQSDRRRPPISMSEPVPRSFGRPQ